MFAWSLTMKRLALIWLVTCTPACSGDDVAMMMMPQVDMTAGESADMRKSGIVDMSKGENPDLTMGAMPDMTMVAKPDMTMGEPPDMSLSGIGSGCEDATQ